MQICILIVALLKGVGFFYRVIEGYCNFIIILWCVCGAAVLVTGVQVSIALLAKFREGRLDEYVDCFVESIYGNDSSGTLPANVTFPVGHLLLELFV